MSGPAPVRSVAGRRGAIVLANTDISGLGTASTHAATDFDAAGSASAVQGTSLQKSSNLSDLSNVVTARTNLGVAATASVFQIANNLSEGNAGTMRTSLGLGTAAVTNTGTSSGNVPVLDSGGKLNTAVLPPLAIGATFVVSSQAAMLALTAEEGDIAVRTDQNKTYRLTTNDPTQLGNWQELLVSGESPVQSVAGKVGVVSLVASDVGLGNVANALQLVAANNLSDLTDAGAARGSLGLGTAATSASTDFDPAGSAASIGMPQVLAADNNASGGTVIGLEFNDAGNNPSVSTINRQLIWPTAGTALDWSIDGDITTNGTFTVNSMVVNALYFGGQEDSGINSDGLGTTTAYATVSFAINSPILQLNTVIVDASNLNSVSTNARQLYDNAAGTALDWSTPGSITASGVTITATAFVGDGSGLTGVTASPSSLMAVLGVGANATNQTINANDGSGAGAGNILNTDGGFFNFSDINGSYASASQIRTGTFGTVGGISIVCSAGFELNWQTGVLSSWNGATFVPIIMGSPIQMNSNALSLDSVVSIVGNNDGTVTFNSMTGAIGFPSPFPFNAANDTTLFNSDSGVILSVDDNGSPVLQGYSPGATTAGVLSFDTTTGQVKITGNLSIPIGSLFLNTNQLQYDNGIYSFTNNDGSLNFVGVSTVTGLPLALPQTLASGTAIFNSGSNTVFSIDANGFPFLGIGGGGAFAFDGSGNPIINGNLNLNGLVPVFTIPSYTVATLPFAPPVGTKAFATDALKPGQLTGAGTGRGVEYDGTSWFTGDGLAVLN